MAASGALLPSGCRAQTHFVDERRRENGRVPKDVADTLQSIRLLHLLPVRGPGCENADRSILAIQKGGVREGELMVRRKVVVDSGVLHPDRRLVLGLEYIVVTPTRDAPV